MASENEQIVRRLWAAVERQPGTSGPPFGHESGRIPLDLCDEQIEIRNPPEFPVADEYHGHDGLRQWAREVWEVFSEIHHDVEEVIELEDGGTVVTVVWTRGVMRHTGLETRFRWATVWTIRNGKALSAHGYMTKQQALEAVGIAPGRPPMAPESGSA